MLAMLLAMLLAIEVPGMVTLVPGMVTDGMFRLDMFRLGTLRLGTLRLGRLTVLELSEGDTAAEM